MKKGHQNHWWGETQLELDETAKWEIGPLRLWVHRGSSEWWLAHDWLEEDSVEWSLHRAAEFPDDEADAERFAVSETTSSVHLRPLPAARPVVARPKAPLRVLPGQLARVFLSSPLWVEISVGGGAVPTVLRELPTKRLSDTWFGATTREGELAYALKTSARTGLEKMPLADYRLLTPVVIENRATDPLLVERLSLPVPYLSIYGSDSGAVWSEEVGMLRTEDGGMAELDVRDGPPVEAAGARKLSEPRRIAEEGHLFRAFGSLLGFD